MNESAEGMNSFQRSVFLRENNGLHLYEDSSSNTQGSNSDIKKSLTINESDKKQIAINQHTEQEYQKYFTLKSHQQQDQEDWNSLLEFHGQIQIFQDDAENSQPNLQVCPQTLNKNLEEEECVIIGEKKKMRNNKNIEKKDENVVHRQKFVSCPPLNLSDEKMQKIRLARIPIQKDYREKTAQDLLLEAIQIRSETIAKMYTLIPKNFRRIKYIKKENESDLKMKVFAQIQNDILYHFLTKMRSSNLAKMRTLIVRRVLDKMVDKLVPLKTHLNRDKPNKRMTKLDRERYDLAEIPVPPSRMNNQYLQQVFQIDKIRQFYHDYTSTHLKKYLIDINKVLIIKFQQNLNLIMASKCSDQIKLLKIRKLKKPFNSIQIIQFLDEARNIKNLYTEDEHKSNKSDEDDEETK